MVRTSADALTGCLLAWNASRSRTNQPFDREYSRAWAQTCRCTSSGCATCVARRRRSAWSSRDAAKAARPANLGPITRTSLSRRLDPCSAATGYIGAPAGSSSGPLCSPATRLTKSPSKYRGKLSHCTLPPRNFLRPRSLGGFLLVRLLIGRQNVPLEKETENDAERKDGRQKYFLFLLFSLAFFVPFFFSLRGLLTLIQCCIFRTLRLIPYWLLRIANAFSQCESTNTKE